MYVLSLSTVFCLIDIINCLESIYDPTTPILQPLSPNCPLNFLKQINVWTLNTNQLSQVNFLSKHTWCRGLRSSCLAKRRFRLFNFNINPGARPQGPDVSIDTGRFDPIEERESFPTCEVNNPRFEFKQQNSLTQYRLAAYEVCHRRRTWSSASRCQQVNIKLGQISCPTKYPSGAKNRPLSVIGYYASNRTNYHIANATLKFATNERVNWKNRSGVLKFPLVLVSLWLFTYRTISKINSRSI